MNDRPPTPPTPANSVAVWSYDPQANIVSAVVYIDGAPVVVATIPADPPVE